MDILQLIDRLEELFNQSKSIPLTRNVMVDEDRMLDIIDQMRIAIPEEVKKAQQLLGQRDRVLAQAQEEANRTLYAAGITQSLTPRWIAQVNYEGTADSGFLNNPYRSVFTLDGGTAPEHYPEARTGHAWVLRTGFGLVPGSADDLPIGQRSSIQFDYRYYQDTFAVQSHTGKVEYQRYVRNDWLIGSFYRYYRQGEASFYGDRVPSTQLFKARDKELSRFSDHWISGSLKYKPRGFNWHGLENLSILFSYSFLMYDYDNFTDPRTGALYSQRAHVLHTSLGFTY